MTPSEIVRRFRLNSVTQEAARELMTQTENVREMLLAIQNGPTRWDEKGEAQLYYAMKGDFMNAWWAD